MKRNVKKLFIEIQEKALAWSIAEATHAEIDELNILQATFWLCNVQWMV